MNFFESLSNFRNIYFIILIGLIVRLIFVFFFPDQNFPDAQAYRNIGIEIFSGKQITNDISMPLYPIITYIAGSETSQRLLDLFFSLISIWLIFKISYKLFANLRAAYVASIFSTFYPHFIFYSISGLTETFFTLLILCAFYFFYSRAIFLGIIFLALSVLVRPTLDFLNPIILLLFTGVVHQYSFKKTLMFQLIYFLVYVFFMTPWWIHQYSKYGEFVRLNLGDGIVLYSGNNPLNESGGGVGRKNGKSDMDLSQFQSIDNPIQRNYELKRAAYDYIVENPSRFVELGIKKFFRFWRLWPYADEYKSHQIIISSILSYGLVLFLSIGFFYKRHIGFKEISPIIALIVYLTLVHTVTISSIRYRFPIEPFLIIFGTFQLTRINSFKPLLDFVFRNKKS